jgi:hypothetical protein
MLYANVVVSEVSIHLQILQICFLMHLYNQLEQLVELAALALSQLMYKLQIPSEMQGIACFLL